MGFGNDAVTTLTGERKQITVVDMDKEYGKASQNGKFLLTDSDQKSYEEVLEEIKQYREWCIELISDTHPSWGARDYADRITPVNGELTWKISFVKDLDTTQLGTMRAHLERLVEQGINPLNL